MRFALLALTLACAGAASIDQYLNAPFSSGLTAAPSGGKVAWLMKEKGANNIWVAAAPDFKGRRLTSITEDDGQEIGELAWTSDGKSIVYVRGGDLETNGDNPNPESLAKTPEQAVWIVPFDGGPPKKLSEGRMPAVSKNGDVAFVRNGQIWLTNLNGDKPAEIVHTKGRSTELRWSPDGTMIAFVNARSEHAFIGVFKIGAKSVGYLDPSVDSDTAPAWSTDSRHSSECRPGLAPVARARCETLLSRGRSALPTRQLSLAAKYGAPNRKREARFMRWSRRISCCGPMETGSSFRGKATAGVIFIRSPLKAAKRSS